MNSHSKIVSILKLLFVIISSSFSFYLKHFNKKKLKTALCVMAKREKNYIVEFVDYYKKLGASKIFIYDNNDVDGERYNTILEKYINDKFVEIFDYRGLFKPQANAYNECYTKNKYEYNWFVFYDIDEYLYFTNFTNINDFLSQPQFENCSSILINWKYYGDNDKLYYEPKPLKERFTKPYNFSERAKRDILLYGAAKTIARGGGNITWAHFPHFLNDSKMCNALGHFVEKPLSPPDHSVAYIKHYATKSTEEYAEHLRRGGGCSKNQNSKGFMMSRIRSYYFLFNRVTKKKIEILEKALNIRIRRFYNKVEDD